MSSNSFSSFKRFNIPYKDKTVHFFFYFVFVVLWVLSFSRQYSDKRKLRLSVLLAAVFYGILIEICQGLFTKNRSADILDVLANSAGAATAVLVLWLINRNKK